MKQFSLSGAVFETRLFVRHEDGNWAGYSYAWNGADAEWVRGGRVSEVAGQEWTFPSASMCLACHSQAAEGTLGPEIGQLNGDLLYPSTGRVANQLRTLDHIGILDSRRRGAGHPGGDPGSVRDRGSALARPRLAPHQLLLLPPARGARRRRHRPALRHAVHRHEDVRRGTDERRPRDREGTSRGTGRARLLRSPVAHLAPRRLRHAAARIEPGRRRRRRPDSGWIASITSCP